MTFRKSMEKITEVVQEKEDMVEDQGAEAKHFAQEVEDQGAEHVKIIKEALMADHVEKTHTFIESRGFHILVTSTTILNVIQMGFEADFPEWTRIWVIVENIFTAVFAFEMVSKLCTNRWKYFHDAANCLDCFLTLLGIFDCWIMPIVRSGGDADLQTFSVLRLLRLFRLVRMIKLVRSVKPLVLVLQGVMTAMTSAFYVFLVCLCVFYVVAIFLTEHLGKSPSSHMYPGFSTEMEDIDEMEILVNYNPYLCWGSMLSSMMTLFNITTGTEWADIIRPILIKQPQYVPVLLLFAIVVGFSIMNVLIGVIVDCVNQESRNLANSYQDEIKKAKLKIMEKIEAILKELDADGDGTINAKELREAMTCNDGLCKLMSGIDFPLGWDADELLDMLDSSGLGEVSYGNFTASLFRMMNSNDFQQMCMIQKDINQVKRLLSYQHEHTQDKVLAMAADITFIKNALEIGADNQEISVSTSSSKATSSSNAERSSGPERLRGQKATTFRGVPCSRPGEEQTNIVSQEFAHAEETTAEACVAVVPTSEASQKPKLFDLAPHIHLEEVLNAALKAVHECIQEEIAAPKTTFDQDLKNLKARNQIYRTEVAPVIAMQSRADVAATTRSRAIGDHPPPIQDDAVALTECSVAPSRHSELLIVPTVLTDGVRDDNKSSVHRTSSLENTSAHDRSESIISLKMSERYISL